MKDIFFDPRLWQIVALSLEISLTAVVLATALGLPVGAVVAVGRFPGRRAAIVLLNALMGLPPVVVGLLVYLLLSRAGPLGHFGLLFTPPAMVPAHTILIVPILAALPRQLAPAPWAAHPPPARPLAAPGLAAAPPRFLDARGPLTT